MSRTLRPLAALAMVAVIVAGCSSAPAGTGSSNSTAATHEKAMKFAECMRDNGVSEFPDPDACGALTKFAQCIRDNGVKDFPDPTEDGPLIDVEGARSKPGLEAAMQSAATT